MQWKKLLLEFLLDEATLKQLRLKYPEKLDLLDSFSEKAPGKYLPWLMSKSGSEQPDVLLGIVDRFEALLKKGLFDKAIAAGNAQEADKNIDSWMGRSFQDLGAFLDKIDTSTGRETRKSAKAGSEVLYQDERYFVVAPENKEATCYYGAGTKWCITSRGVSHYEDYSNNGYVFIFVFDKTPEKQSEAKVAYAFVPNLNKEAPPFLKLELFDSENEVIEPWIDFYNEYPKPLRLEMQRFAREKGKKLVQKRLKEQGGVLTERGWVFDGDLNLLNLNLVALPIILKVGGHFFCNHNQLTTLEGAPKEVGGCFSCCNNQLTTLEGAPEKVGGNFFCHDNRLTTLEGAPQTVGGHFYCNYNQLTTLEGAPKEVGGHFWCNNNRLTTLEGAPEKVGGGFYCEHNPLPPNKTVEQLLKEAREPKR